MTAPTYDADVIIVGAGPVGLTLASLLRRERLDVLVLEARQGLSAHPKARGVAARTMETFRTLGIEEEVRAVALPAAHVRFFRGESLSDPHAQLSEPGAGGGEANTPSPGVLCSQDRLEPVLASAARRGGARLRFGAPVTGVRGADADAPYAEVSLALPGGAVSLLRARAVVGCDGVSSIVRRGAGIGLTGEANLAQYLSVRCTAPLGPLVRGREAVSYFISGGRGGFLAVDNDSEWIYQYPLGAAVDAAALRTDHARLAQLVRDAAGVPDLAVEISDTMLWRMHARVADGFRAGRLLLAGDAAHQVPPTGGHGMNLGIGDAETLSWRLGAVLRGEADWDSLDRYGAERGPLARAVVELSLGNASRAYGIDDEVLLTSGYPPASPIAPGEYAPSGDPGRRLPHAGLDGDPLAESVLDLGAGRFRLVCVTGDAEWEHAVRALSPEVVYAPIVAGTRVERSPGSFARRAGLREGEALLVRPDGHIAARCPAEVSERHEWLRAELRAQLVR